MNGIWMINSDDFLSIYEEAILLGRERGKIKGDNLEEEFFEIAKKKGLLDKLQLLGQTDMDKDLLLGNLREEGIKVLDIDEIKRQQQKKEE